MYALTTMGLHVGDVSDDKRTRGDDGVNKGE